MLSSRSLFTVLALAILLLSMFLNACDNSVNEHTFAFATMGTEASCKLMLPANVSTEEAEKMVVDSFSLVNNDLSTWSKTSEISRLNRCPADSAFTVSPLLKTCLLLSRELGENSGGAFDPTAESLMRLWGFYRRQGKLPSSAELDAALADLGHWRLPGNKNQLIKDKPGTRFDLGGIAKGLAVDLAALKLRNAGVSDGLIDLGGNLYCLGGAPGRENWRVGIRNPLNRDELFATVSISNESIATSGSYERFVMIDGKRYGHIMNPATGQPAEGMLSATVIANEGILADGLSTTLFVLGPEKAMDFLKKHYPMVETVLVVQGERGEKNRVIITAALEGRISILPEFEKQYQLVVSH